MLVVKNKSEKKEDLALNVHVNMNICKLRNVYDATAVANAAHREKFMINMLKYANYFYACIECTYFRGNISPHVLLDEHFMSRLN